MLAAGDPGYSARRLQGFPLPGTKGYPSSHYKCAPHAVRRNSPVGLCVAAR